LADYGDQSVKKSEAGSGGFAEHSDAEVDPRVQHAPVEAIAVVGHQPEMNIGKHHAEQHFGHLLDGLITQLGIFFVPVLSVLVRRLFPAARRTKRAKRGACSGIASGVTASCRALCPAYSGHPIFPVILPTK
jgi:hypothetical protein